MPSGKCSNVLRSSKCLSTVHDRNPIMMQDRCFSRWLAGTSWPLLVQDHERALWCPEPLAAFRSIGVEVVARHPKHSPDLNAIENAWKFLRSRLGDTRRPGREGREPFLVRLRSAVAWINKNHGLTLRKLCRNQRLRASDVLAQDGPRTKW